MSNMTVSNLTTQVVIVGGGPAGLMLALELGRRNVRCVLFNDGPSTTNQPQANATQARTMEHFRRLGFADAVRDLGLPADYPTDITYFTRYSHHELARFALPTRDEAKAMAHGLTGSWSAAELPHRCSQMYIERVLHQQVQALPSVTLMYGWRVGEVLIEAKGVDVKATEAGGQGVCHVSADYVAGCDGPRSLVRTKLDITYAGSSGAVRNFFGGRMHAVYFRSTEFYDVVNRPKAWMYWAFNRERRSFIAAINGRDEFAFHTQLSDDENDTLISDVQAEEMVCQTMGCEFDFEVISRGSWTAGFALVAEKMSAGRAFLLGDAAHLFTPAGGLGYNTAIEDAVNLGWKLAAVIQGWGGYDLLASFDAERRPAAQRNTGYARDFADSIGLYSAAPGLEDDSPQGVRLRTEAGAYLDAHARAEFDIPGITFGTRYDASPIVVADGTQPPPDTANKYVPTACPGGRAPHAWLSESQSLYDLFGFDFTLLRFGREQGEELIDIAQAIGAPLTVVDLDNPDFRALYQADLALIRPDQVVAWRGNSVDDAYAIWQQVRGA